MYDAHVGRQHQQSGCYDTTFLLLEVLATQEPPYFLLAR